MTQQIVKSKPVCLRCGRYCSELGQNRMMICDLDIERWIREERWDILKNVTQCPEGSWLKENSCYSIIKENGFTQCRTCHSGGLIINTKEPMSGKCLFLKEKDGVFECSIEETKPNHCIDWGVGEYEGCPQCEAHNDLIVEV